MTKLMKKSVFLLILLIWASVLPGCNTPADEAGQTVRIGILTVGDSRTAKIEGMKQGIKDLGWTSQQIEYRVFNAKDYEEQLVEGAKSLIRQRPNVLVATGVIEAQAIVQAMQGQSPIPVVLVGVTSPGELDIKKSFDDAGIPVMGVDNGHVELTGKRMELLRILFPERDKILIFFDPRLKASKLALQKAKEMAAIHDWHIEPVPIKQDADLQALKARHFTDKDSVLILPSFYLESKYREIRDLSFQKKIPVMGLYESETLAGYTASYGISYFDQGKQSARLVVRAFDPKAPLNLPFETPDVVQLKLNMEAAARMGVRFSQQGLAYGEKITEIRK